MNTAFVVEWTLNNCRSMEAFADMEAARRFTVLVSDMRPQIHELAIRTEMFLQAMGLPCAVPDRRCQTTGACQELGACNPAIDRKLCKPCNDTGATHCADPANCGGPWDDRAPCGCPLGMCESKPVGCRMAAEVRRDSRAQ